MLLATSPFDAIPGTALSGTGVKDAVNVDGAIYSFLPHKANAYKMTTPVGDTGKSEVQ
jgi:hypothetical protein